MSKVKMYFQQNQRWNNPLKIKVVGGLPDERRAVKSDFLT
jgi:hypothetical protein